MYVCICQAITDRQIKKAAASGLESVDQLRDTLGVASCCGSCADAAQQVLDECSAGSVAGPTIYRPGINGAQSA